MSNPTSFAMQDTAAIIPGEFEATLAPHPHLYKGRDGESKRRRDQNLLVPWHGCSFLLQQYAKTRSAGGMEAYRQRTAPVTYTFSGGTLVGREAFPRSNVSTA